MSIFRDINDVSRKLLGMPVIDVDERLRDTEHALREATRTVERLSAQLNDAERVIGEYWSCGSSRQLRIEGPPDTYTWVGQPKQHEPATQYFLKYPPR